MKHMKNPGMVFVGDVKNPAVNNGQPVPVYTMAPSAAHSHDINTVEGWNAAAEKQNRRSFFCEFGRDPTDRTELYAWVNGIVAACKADQKADSMLPQI